MFCPVCRKENNPSNQFCRSCGTDLMPARLAVSASEPANARELVARSLADRIKQIETAEDLKIVAEEVLPQIEKFLESPEERLLRRQRTGSIIAFIGMGVALGTGLMAIFIGQKHDEFLFLMGLGIITFFIGAAFLINAAYFSLTKPGTEDLRNDAKGEPALLSGSAKTSDLVLPEGRPDEYISITEPTTRQLEKSGVAIDKKSAG